MWIPGRMPSLNEVLRLRGHSGHAYNRLKKHWVESVGTLARDQGFAPGGRFWTYLFLEPNSRRDISNIISVATKFAEDGLIAARVLENDNMEHVLEIRPHVAVTEGGAGVFVVTHDKWTFTLSETWEQLEENEQWKKSKSQNPNPSKTTSTPSSRSRGRSSASSKGSRVPTRSGALSALQKARSPKEVQAAKAELKRMGLLSKNSR